MSKELEINWESIRDSKPVKYSGLGIGTVFQFAEHSPRTVEDVAGLDVPKSLFEEVFNPYEMDKAVHFYFCYSASNMVLDSMEESSVNFTYPDKMIAVHTGTVVGGFVKELTDAKIDPYDMVANIAGGYMALKHHKSRLEDKYEEELGIDVSNENFMTAEMLYHRRDDEGFNVNNYLQEAD